MVDAQVHAARHADSMQRISVAMQIAAVSEIRQALGMSLAFGRRRERVEAVESDGRRR